MSIVASFTRDEWYSNGEWSGVDSYVDGVRLNFLEEEDAESDIEPVIVRIDPDTWQPWPQDDVELPDVPFRFYARDDENPSRWTLEDEGADKESHTRIIMTRQNK